MYLYGKGDGEPVRDIPTLLEASGVHVDTLRKHRKVWDREAEEMARNAHDNPLGLGLRESVVAEHALDVHFLRIQTENLKTEVDNLESLSENLLELLERLAIAQDFDETQSEKALSLLQGYLKTSYNRQKVLSLFLSVQKRWQDTSGMESALKIWEAGERERLKRKARLGEDPPPNTELPAAPSSDRFATKGKPGP